MTSPFCAAYTSAALLAEFFAVFRLFAVPYRSLFIKPSFAGLGAVVGVGAAELALTLAGAAEVRTGLLTTGAGKNLPRKDDFFTGAAVAGAGAVAAVAAAALAAALAGAATVGSFLDPNPLNIFFYFI